jgi:hypothetical protein
VEDSGSDMFDLQDTLRGVWLVKAVGGEGEGDVVGGVGVNLGVGLGTLRGSD